LTYHERRGLFFGKKFSGSLHNSRAEHADRKWSCRAIEHEYGRRIAVATTIVRLFKVVSNIRRENASRCGIAARCTFRRDHEGRRFSGFRQCRRCELKTLSCMGEPRMEAVLSFLFFFFTMGSVMARHEFLSIRDVFVYIYYISIRIYT